MGWSSVCLTTEALQRIGAALLWLETVLKQAQYGQWWQRSAGACLTVSAFPSVDQTTQSHFELFQGHGVGKQIPLR